MKRFISAVAAGLALTSVSAYADVQKSFPDGYVVLSAAELAPRAGAVSEWEIRKNFPRGSFRTQDALTPQDRAPVANAVSSTELLAGFPQPSFRDYPEAVRNVRSVQQAGTSLETSAN